MINYTLYDEMRLNNISITVKLRRRSIYKGRSMHSRHMSGSFDYNRVRKKTVAQYQYQILGSFSSMNKLLKKVIILIYNIVTKKPSKYSPT